MLSVFRHLTVFLIIFSPVLIHVFLTVFYPNPIFLCVKSSCSLSLICFQNPSVIFLHSCFHLLPFPTRTVSSSLHLSGVCASDRFKLRLMMNETTHPWGTDLGSSVGWCSATHWTCGSDSLFMACTNTSPTSWYLYL